jgi:hypothetical protein
MLLSTRLVLPFILPLALIGGGTVAAEPPASHGIPLEMEACMAEAESHVAASLACAEHAETAWRDAVERLSARLASTLGRDSRDALETADEAWQASRDAELAFIDAYHTQLEEAELGDPALLPLARQWQRNAVFEARVAHLERFLEGLESIPEAVPEEALPPRASP